MGKRCEDTGLWCRKPGIQRDGRTEVQAQMVEKLKENHILGEFENIIHVVSRRLKEVGIWCWRT